MAKTCLKCKGPVPARETGRPASFCSVACRRAAEYELRRAQAQLTQMENERLRCRLDRSGLLDMNGSTPEQRAADLTREIELAEIRLRELLAAGADQPDH